LLKAIVLDFDGVILESVDIKTRAFQTVFRGHPEHLDRITRLHLENGGMSRHEKFAIIYRDFLRRPLSDQERERLGREFSECVEREILSCPFVTGAPVFLERHADRLPLFVVSGTPEDELVTIVRRRKLDGYFRGVYGSPRQKPELLGSLLAVHALKPSEVVFVGDSMTDCRAADATGVHFVGRVRNGESNPFPKTVNWIVSDLADLTNQWTCILSSLADR
jgi:HAD superfamily hydrolase (TIGR01549 family)